MAVIVVGFKRISSVRADDTMTSFSLVEDRNSLKNHNNQVNNKFSTAKLDK
jgi:hypothetical protein